jgi:hypothetical protein
MKTQKKAVLETNYNNHFTNLRKTERKDGGGNSGSTSTQNGSSSQAFITDAPYDTQNTLDLITDLGSVVLPADDNTKNYFLGCMQYLKDKPQNYQSMLTQFWNDMGGVATQKTQWDNNFFMNVINSMKGKQALYNTQTKNCLEFRITNFDMQKVMDKLNQGKYFGGFNTVKPSGVFISGMVSHHRDIINADTFTNINIVSRQGSLPSPSGSSPG